MSGQFQGFRAKKSRLHVALRECNSGTESSRERFKGSKDSASLLVCTQEQFFGSGYRFFVQLASYGVANRC